jgi:hypothetical protein
MKAFFESNTGKILRGLFFIPIGGLVFEIVQKTLQKILEHSGTLIGDMFFPYAIGVFVSNAIAAEIYPGKNKMYMLYGYIIFVSIFLFGGLYVFFTTDEKLGKPLVTVINMAGTIAGYALCWWQLKDEYKPLMLKKSVTSIAIWAIFIGRSILAVTLAYFLAAMMLNIIIDQFPEDITITSIIVSIVAGIIVMGIGLYSPTSLTEVVDLHKKSPYLLTAISIIIGTLATIEYCFQFNISIKNEPLAISKIMFCFIVFGFNILISRNAFKHVSKYKILYRNKTEE